MLKIRVTFVDDGKHENEVGRLLDDLGHSFDIVNQSNVYKGRGNSQYSNIYIDLERKDNEG